MATDVVSGVQSTVAKMNGIKIGRGHMWEVHPPGVCALTKDGSGLVVSNGESGGGSSKGFTTQLSLSLSL